jgi:hypothetical protein
LESDTVPRNNAESWGKIAINEVITAICEEQWYESSIYVSLARYFVATKALACFALHSFCSKYCSFYSNATEPA